MVVPGPGAVVDVDTLEIGSVGVGAGAVVVDVEDGARGVDDTAGWSRDSALPVQAESKTARTRVEPLRTFRAYAVSTATPRASPHSG